MAEKIKFGEYEVEHDIEKDKVKIKKKGESEFKDAKEHTGDAFLLYRRKDGTYVETKDGDMALTQSNPICWWIFSGGKWKLKCVN